MISSVCSYLNKAADPIKPYIRPLLLTGIAGAALAALYFSSFVEENPPPDREQRIQNAVCALGHACSALCPLTLNYTSMLTSAVMYQNALFGMSHSCFSDSAIRLLCDQSLSLEQTSMLDIAAAYLLATNIDHVTKTMVEMHLGYIPPTPVIQLHLLHVHNNLFCEFLKGTSFFELEALREIWDFGDWASKSMVPVISTLPAIDHQWHKNRFTLSMTPHAQNLKNKVLWLQSMHDYNKAFLLRSDSPFLEPFHQAFQTKYVQVVSVQDICQAVRNYGSDLAGLIIAAHGSIYSIALGTNTKQQRVTIQDFPSTCFTSLHPDAVIFINSCLTAGSTNSTRPNFASQLHKMTQRTVIANRQISSGPCLFLEGPHLTDIESYALQGASCSSERIDVTYKT